MVETAAKRASQKGLTEKVKFVIGDSQDLPFPENAFDIVINECAVGIPDDLKILFWEIILPPTKG